MRNEPKILKEIVFGRFLDEAELAELSPEEVWKYEQRLKHYRDYYNVVATAYEEGLEAGRQEARAKAKAKEKAKVQTTLRIAAKMKAGGMSVEIIIKFTGLPAEVIEGL